MATRSKSLNEHSIHGIVSDSRLELRHLRYFVTVAEMLHFGRAAKALYISQPPLSRQVRDLESWVGVPLLNRSAKAVTLTEAGAVFLQESKRILGDISVSVQKAQRTAAGEMGSLAIAFDPLFDSGLLAGIRDALTQSYPDVRLSEHRVYSDEQAGMIRRGSFDAGFLLLPAADGDQLTREPLFREAAVALVSAAHPLSRKTEVTVKDLARYPVLEVGSYAGTATYGHAGRIGTMCGVALHVECWCPAFEKLPQMLRDSNALALLPSSIREVCGEEIRCLKISDPCADFTFGLLYDRARVSNVLAHFIELARRANETQSRLQKSTMAAA